MTSEVRVAPLDGTPAFEISPHNCFACGTLNTGGLQLDLHMEAGRSWTELTLDRRFQGWDGIAHGGIICAILDEVMAWALVAEDHWGVTARMHVEFKRPVEIGRPIRGDGWVTRSRRRVVDAAGRHHRRRDRRDPGDRRGHVRGGDRRPEARAAGALRLPTRRQYARHAWTTGEPPP